MSNLIKKIKEYFLNLFLPIILCLFIILFMAGCGMFSSLIQNAEFQEQNMKPPQKQESTQEQSTEKNKDISEYREESKTPTSYQDSEPEGAYLEIIEDPANEEIVDDDPLEKDYDNTLSKPGVSLQIILGPEYAQENSVCYWRIKAVVSGNPAPEIKFSRDDSNGSWGPDIVQVNLSEGQSYTLICDIKNSEGSASSSLTLGWIENKEVPDSGQSQSQQSEQDSLQIDYQDVANFKIDVNLSTQRVTVYYKDSAIKSMVCSGGLPQSPTPIGNFTTYQKIYYAWVAKYNQGAYYWTRFYGSYLIHSVPFDKNGNIISEEYAKLGSPASHGCVRLEVEDAKWLYEVIPLGVSVVIHN